MKNNFIFLLFLFLICCKSNEESNEMDIDQLEINREAQVERSIESIDVLVNEVIIASQKEESTQKNMRTLNCRSVELNSENKILTINFGEECKDDKGNIHKGKIKIAYSQLLFKKDAKRELTFENYYFNGIKISGKRIITNTTDNLLEMQFSIIFQNGIFDFGNGSTVTRDANWTKTWLVGQKKVTLFGKATGKNTKGEKYTAEINADSPLIFNFNCQTIIPVSGKKIWTVGSRQSNLNYGEGDCDNKVTILYKNKNYEREVNVTS